MKNLAEKESPTEHSTEPRTSLLLAEDEILIAMNQKSELEKYGYTVHHVFTGEEAIEAVLGGEVDIDLILMDVDLGKGIDGTQAAQEILRRKNIPIVFLSSHTEREVVEKTEKITSYGYVVKNSGIVVLDASIKMALKLFQAQHSLEESRVVVREKIRAITEAEYDLGPLELSDLINVEELQSILEDFNHITGMLSAILDIKGNILIGVGWQDICTKFHRVNPESAKHCVESDTMLANGARPGEFKAYRCKNNMWDMASPIVIAGRHMGNIYFGQYFYDDEEVDVELFRKQAKQYGYDEEKYLAALEKVPRFSQDMVNTAMRFYTKIAKIISEMSYNNIRLSRVLTERNKALERAVIGEEKFRSLARNIPDVLFITDTSGIITYLSPASKRVFGYDTAEMVGKPFSSFLREDQISVAMEKFRDTIFSCRSTSNFSLIALKADKAELPIEIHASILS